MYCIKDFIQNLTIEREYAEGINQLYQTKLYFEIYRNCVPHRFLVSISGVEGWCGLKKLNVLHMNDSANRRVDGSAETREDLWRRLGAE